AIGYWFEHKSYNSKEPFSKYEVTIDELEANTDIDFFPNLPSDIEKDVEKSKDNWKW
ncbi:endonuclease, partial [Bacteroides xylanisolvens]